MTKNNIRNIIVLGISFAMMLVFALGLPSFAQAQYYNNCSYHTNERCVGNNLYWYDSCGNQQDFIQTCPGGCYNSMCQTGNYYNPNFHICTYHAYEMCSGNNLYWYDSCNNQQDLAQYCVNGCLNNSCGYTNNYNNYNSGYNSNGCTYHAYRTCIDNNVYWYDSCGRMQDFVVTCTNGMACQYGQCVYSYTVTQPVVPTYTPSNPSYIAHYRTSCYGNSLYWYDSLGASSGLYKSCQDSNSCTADTCSGSKCSNTIKCDGSTCAVGSADYLANCPAVAVPAPVTTPVQNNGLSVSFLTKQNATSTQWQKASQVGSNGTVYFMISAINNSATQIDNVTVSANIPSAITSLGNLQLNGIPIAGDIVTGVNIGSVASQGTKSVTFEGKTQTIATANSQPAIATSNASGFTQSDTVSINFSPSQAVAAAVSAAPATSGFLGFLKRWYLWILIGLALVILFVIIFKRLSSNV